MVVCGGFLVLNVLIGRTALRIAATAGSLALFAGVVTVNATAASAAVSRDTVIAHAEKWMADNPPYDQGSTHDGYRTDCSGMQHRDIPYPYFEGHSGSFEPYRGNNIG